MKNYLPQNIRFLRMSKGVKQEELGKALGKGATTIGNYESGYRNPSTEDVRAIAKFFHVSVDKLLSEDISGVQDGDLKAEWMYEELKRLALSDAEFNMLESYIDYIKSLRSK